MIKDRGKEGRERRRWIRDTWAASLPQAHRYVFIVVGQSLEDVEDVEDVEDESELYDDLVVVDISESDLYTEHRQRLVALYFSFSLCLASWPNSSLSLSASL